MAVHGSRKEESPRVLLKRSHSPFQADVWRIDRDDGSVVEKTFARQPWIIRRTFGAWVTSREVRNLRQLDGIEGIPRIVTRPAPWSFEMTFMLAEDLPTREARSTVTAEYFDALDEIVSNIHSRGMTHGDLRRRNLMRHPQTGLPVVIDFTQSLSRRNPLLRLFLPLARRIDRSKLLRLREWYVGAENMSQEQRRKLEDGTPLSLRVGQMLRSRLYRPLKHWYKGEKSRRPRSQKGKRRP